MKYHIKDNGEPGKCTAHVRGCPLGSDAPHFETKNEAAQYYEETMQDSIIEAPQQKEKKTIFKKVGATALATLALTTMGTNIAHANEFTAPPVQTIQKTFSFDDLANSFGNTDSSSSFNDLYETYKNKSADEISSELNDWFNGDFSSIDSQFGSNSGFDRGYDANTEGIQFQGKSLSVTQDEVDAAKETLSQLQVRPEKERNDYDRKEMFGRSFETGVVGKTERRDITEGIFKNDAPQARAIGGTFIDPYTGEEVQIVKGSSTDADVDHVVPLKEAMRSETRTLSHQERINFANDPDNLQMTASSVNRSKSDKDPGEWVPSFLPAQKAYVISTINVKNKYDLSVDQQEFNAMNDILNK